MRGKKIYYEDLDIREDGTIYYDGEPKNCSSNSAGYLVTGFNGKIHYVHRLVADKYIRNPANKRTVNHKNGIKNDNRVENLEWNTNKENLQHAYDTGLNNQNHRRKLTMEQVREIRSKYIPYKYSMDRLCKEYEVSHTTIKFIIKNKSYIDNTNLS